MESTSVSAVTQQPLNILLLGSSKVGKSTLLA